MDAIIIFSLIVSSLIIFFRFILNPKPDDGRHHLNLPPSPPKLPLIGNLHQLAGSLPHRAFRDLAKKYGPIMHIQLVQLSVIVVTSPRLAKEVLKTNDIAIANRPSNVVSEIVFYDKRDIAFSPYGDYWRQLRKICALQLLSAKKVQSFGPIRQQEFNRFMKFISLNPNGEPIDVHVKIFEMINNVICASSLGNNCRQQRKLLDLIYEAGVNSNAFSLADLFPDYEFVSVILGRKAKLLKVRKNLDKILDEILEERQIHGVTNDHEVEDLLQVLLRIKEEGGLQFEIANNNIKAILADIFIAGTDTTTVTLEWALTELIRNPAVMKKVQTEVREAFKGKTTITDADLHSLSYMHLVIKESLRLHPPGPLLLPRECRESCKIDGYDIQVKQKVFVDAWACGRDPDYWEDAESFKPERFENLSIDFMGNNFEFIPFGAGRRICPGIAFGLKSVEFFLAHLLYFYDWKLPTGLNHIDIDITEMEGAIAGKKDHLRLVPTFYPKVDDDFFRNLYA